MHSHSNDDINDGLPSNTSFSSSNSTSSSWFSSLHQVLPSSSQSQQGKYTLVDQIDDDLNKLEDHFEEENNNESKKQPKEHHNHPAEEVIFTQRTWLSVCIAWISMFLALIAGASIGPLFKYMHEYGIMPCLAASWRCQSMSLILLPMAIAEVLYDKRNNVDWFAQKPDLQFPVIVHVLFSGLAWSGNLLCWIVGLMYTTTFKASILACCHPLLLVIYLQFIGTKLSMFEIVGVFVSFSGVFVSCLKDLIHPEERTDIPAHYQILGYCLCFLAAACEVIVLFNRITTKKYVPLMQYTFATTLIVAICATYASLLLEGTGIVYVPGIDLPHGIQMFCLEDYCIFGWLSHKWLEMILLFGLWVGVVCIAGFNYAVRTFLFYVTLFIFNLICLCVCVYFRCNIFLH